MIFNFLLFGFLLLILFFITKHIVNLKFGLIERFIRNRKLAVYLFSFIFLPGTLIHELSHYIIAVLLRVSTGPLSIFPEFDKDHLEHSKQLIVKTGHIMVAKTDPIRMTLIGVAPMIVGLVIIYFVGNTIQISTPNGSAFAHPSGGIMLFLKIYLLFITSTTMFSSRQDLKSLIITLPFTILIFTALYLSGIKIVLEGNLLTRLERVLGNLNRSLIITGIVDYMVLIVLAGLSRLGARGR